jgi:pimeloyl-ACP methyl ester carboxylesterase
MKTTRILPPTPSAASLAFGQSRMARSLASALRAMHQVAPAFATRLAVDLFFAPVPTKLASRRRMPPAWHLERTPAGRDSFTLLRHRAAAAPQAAGRTRVLLLHGWAGDALQMRPMGDALAAAGFEPVLMDFPAHGRSAGWRCTMPQMVRSLFEAHACAGPFDAVVAHSMGAIACLHAMATGLPTRRLVALAPSSSPGSVLRWFGEAFDLEPDLLARMRARIERDERMALEQFEPQWLGARVTAPVLLVHDRGDRIAPSANSQALAGALPDATLHLTDGLSHRRVLADAAVIERTLAYLGAPLAQ